MHACRADRARPSSRDDGEEEGGDKDGRQGDKADVVAQLEKRLSVLESSADSIMREIKDIRSVLKTLQGAAPPGA